MAARPRDPNRSTAPYTGLQAAWHDRFWESETAAAREAGVWRRRLAASVGQGASVLDAGCGSGRILGPLALAGFKMTGLDSSREMLEAARTRKGCEKAELRCARLPSGLPRGPFDAVISTAFSLMLLPPEDLQRLWGGFHRVLRPGGVLMASFFVPWSDILEGEDGSWHTERVMPLEDGGLAEQHARGKIDLWRQMLVRDLRFIHRDLSGRVCEEMKVREETAYYFPREIQHALEAAGFADVAMTGEWRRTPPRQGDRFFVVEARRGGG